MKTKTTSYTLKHRQGLILCHVVCSTEHRLCLIDLNKVTQQLKEGEWAKLSTACELSFEGEVYSARLDMLPVIAYPLTVIEKLPI